MSHILAIGGGGFQMEDDASPIDDYLVNHYTHAPDQRNRLHAALAAGAVPSTLAINDHAAVLFAGTTVARVVSWRVGSTAYYVSMKEGQVREDAYPSESIASIAG